VGTRGIIPEVEDYIEALGEKDGDAIDKKNLQSLVIWKTALRELQLEYRDMFRPTSIVGGPDFFTRLQDGPNISRGSIELYSVRARRKS
jgi:hypothetical protein